MRIDVLALFWLVAKVVVLLAGLFVPGAALMRALRVPRSVATCFVGSVLSLYATVLALQLGSIRISLGSLAAGLVVITLTTAILARLRREGSEQPSRVQTASRNPGPPRIELPGLRGFIAAFGAWTPLYALFWIAVLWRTWHDPLAGPDIGFRWSFLAEQMLRHGSLDFYPPRSAEDFFTYFWVENIPPGVSALHAWAYACGGNFAAAWTVPGTVLQLWALHELLWRTADRLNGLEAARLACIAAAACPLLTWSVLLAQETGLTALSIVGIAFGLASWRDTPTAGWAALVGGSAALGAAAREYGIVFPLLAAGGLLAVRADRAAWLAFGGAALISVVWPLRAWVLTGNPFFSLPVGGLFPINAQFVARIDYDAAFYGAALQSVTGWREVARYLLLFAPAGLIGWLALAAASLRRGSNAMLGLAAVLVLLALWAASVRYTNGGLFYSLRVTTPALALGALAVGIAIAAIGSYRPRLATPVNIALAFFAIALLPATLALPLNPSRTPWRQWPSFAPRAPDTRGEADPLVALVLKAASTSATASTTRPTDSRPPVILADSPGHQRTFLPTGLRVVPLWSPQADWLFDLSLPAADAARRWRDSGVRFIIVAKWQANLDYFHQFSRWNRPPFRVQRVGETSLAVVFAIDTAD